MLLAGCNCGGTVKVKQSDPIEVKRIDVYHHHEHSVKVQKTRTACTGSILTANDPLNCVTETED